MQFRSRDLSSEQDFVYEQEVPRQQSVFHGGSGNFERLYQERPNDQEENERNRGGLDPVPYRTEQSRTHSARDNLFTLTSGDESSSTTGRGARPAACLDSHGMTRIFA